MSVHLNWEYLTSSCGCRRFSMDGDGCNCCPARELGKLEVPQRGWLKAVTAIAVSAGVTTIWPRGTRLGLGLGYAAKA